MASPADCNTRGVYIRDALIVPLLPGDALYRSPMKIESKGLFMAMSGSVEIHRV
jgi:hypothetical protein